MSPLYLPYISPISPPYLPTSPHTSPISPLYLPCISRLHVRELRECVRRDGVGRHEAAGVELVGAPARDRGVHAVLRGEHHADGRAVLALYQGRARGRRVGLGVGG